MLLQVRKRMVPRMLIFNSRARLAEIVKVDPKTVSVADLDGSIKAVCADNQRSSDGRVQKVTLAIGSGADSKSEL